MRKRSIPVGKRVKLCQVSQEGASAFARLKMSTHNIFISHFTGEKGIAAVFQNLLASAFGDETGRVPLTGRWEYPDWCRPVWKF